ncbi:MAG TPA: glycosyltransferase family 39 protein [Pyrinomonadaceae bacterium]|nr:glycosyltransferase family 39 protein [Pyrinomonadaceae bacterium]
MNEGREAVAVGGRARGMWLILALERYAVVVLVVLAASGFALRLAGIGEVGFAEDEINKLEAVREYARGRIAANAEHPMLMKTLIFVSMSAAGAWNSFAPEAARLSDEVALRLPNILCGALTVFPLFLLTAAFFGRRTGLVAAALWTFGINAITYNRVAKEDTLLVFFMLWAFYFYVRAKATSGFEAREKKRSYVLSGVSFGLMFASKYFPHYFGLNMLYHHYAKLRRREPNEPPGRTPVLFYVVTAATFLVVNPAILLPETWRYLSAYSSESLLTHTGYLMGETLYPNVMSATPFGGTPAYFYLLFLFIKVPLPVVVALGAGLVVCARRWREPGPAFLLLMFLLWVLPYSLVGAKWLRYALSLMPFVYMIAAVGVVATVKAWASWASSTRSPRGNLAWWATGAAMLAVFVAAPAWTAWKSRPHYALYTNALAPERAGYFFPHDEFYDAGLREAVEYVAAHAPPGATIAHETPGVVRYYLERFGRTDLRSRIISDPAFDATEERAPAFFILQRGRTYFENRDELESIRRAGVKRHQVLVRGVSAAEVYSNAAVGESAAASPGGE